MARKKHTSLQETKARIRNKAQQNLEREQRSQDQGNDNGGEKNRHQLKSEITDLAHELARLDDENADGQTKDAVKAEMAARVQQLDDGDRFNQGTYLANQVVSGTLDLQGLYHYSRVVEDVVRSETQSMPDGGDKWAKLGVSQNIRRVNDVLGKGGKVARLQDKVLAEIIEDLGFAELNVDLGEDGERDKSFYIFFPGEGNFAERINDTVAKAAERLRSEAEAAVEAAEEADTEEAWNKADSAIASAEALLSFLVSDSKSGKKGKAEAREAILALTENADPKLALQMAIGLMKDRRSSDEEWEAAKKVALEAAKPLGREKDVKRLVVGRKKAQARKKARRKAKDEKSSNEATSTDKADESTEDTKTAEVEVSEELQADLAKAAEAKASKEAEREQRKAQAEEATEEE